MRFSAFTASIFCACLLLAAVEGHAETPPLPPKKSEVLGDFKNKIKIRQDKASALKEKAADLEKDLGGMQGKLVKLARSMQNSEKSLQKLDAEIETLEKEQAELQVTLEKDRGEMADLVLALQRIRRMPPEALLAKPDAPLKTAQSAMLLENTLPDLYKKAESLKVSLKKSEELSADLKHKRKKVAAATASLQKEHRELSALVQKRKALYRSTQSDIEEQEAQSRRIAAQAKNLKDLVENLNEERDKKREHVRSITRKATLSAVPSPPPSAGQARLPISGVVKTRFNEPDNFGAPSQGLDIVGRGGALVVAPMGGTVRFSGPFKNYGQMVIIEHEGGYHSLVAGLDKVDTVVGQAVVAGEPLGLLHYSDRGGEKPVLYYELRYNGKAVDPARKFSDLS